MERKTLFWRESFFGNDTIEDEVIQKKVEYYESYEPCDCLHDDFHSNSKYRLWEEFIHKPFGLSVDVRNESKDAVMAAELDDISPHLHLETNYSS